MTDRIRKALGDLKAWQDSGEHMPCPRCGRNTMKERVHTNALSRLQTFISAMHAARKKLC